jgi:hypothetical protein
LWPNLRYYSRIVLEVLRKFTEIPTRTLQSWPRFKPGSAKEQVRIITTQVNFTHCYITSFSDFSQFTFKSTSPTETPQWSFSVLCLYVKNITILWNVMVHSLRDGNQHSEGTCCLQLLPPTKLHNVTYYAKTLKSASESNSQLVSGGLFTRNCTIFRAKVKVK